MRVKRVMVGDERREVHAWRNSLSQYKRTTKPKVTFGPNESKVKAGGQVRLPSNATKQGGASDSAQRVIFQGYCSECKGALQWSTP